MKSTLIKDLSKHVGEEITVKGWLYNKRSSGPIVFLELRDGFGWVQAVAAKNDLPAEIPILAISNQQDFYKLKGITACLLKELGVATFEDKIPEKDTDIALS